MKKVLFVIALSLLVALPSLQAQEKQKEKDLKVKVEKKLQKIDGEDKVETKVVVIDNGKVVIEEIGEDIDVDKILEKSGLSEDEIKNIEVKIESDLEGKKMIWITEDGENSEFEITEDANVFVVKGKDGKVHSKAIKPHKTAMFISGGSDVGLYDYSKSDKETKDFDVKQKKELKFNNISISSINRGLHLSFESEDKSVTVKLIDAKGKKLFYEMLNDDENVEFSSYIPVSGEKGSVYILEVSNGDRNWIQKVKVE